MFYPERRNSTRTLIVVCLGNSILATWFYFDSVVGPIFENMTCSLLLV
jgi:hypothetical protein